MIEKDYDLNDIVEMKKEHPCHKSKYWKIIRINVWDVVQVCCFPECSLKRN